MTTRASLRLRYHGGITRLLATIWLSMSGCSVVLPASSAPFSCSDGACPSRYVCREALCVPEGAPAPPLAIGAQADGEGAELLWNGAAFAVVWQANGAAVPGLHLSTLDVMADPRVASDELLSGPQPGSVAFTALYHPGGNAYVVAERANSDSGASLRVSAQPIGGVPAVLYADPEPYTPVGFGNPALCIDGPKRVTLAVTFAAPPAVVAHNGHCLSLDLSGATSPIDCTPASLRASPEDVSDMWLAQDATVRLVMWRAASMHFSYEQGNTEVGSTVVDPIVRIVRAVAAKGADGVAIGAAAFQLRDSSDDAAYSVWGGQLKDFSTTYASGLTVSSVGLAPDVAFADGGFVTCILDHDGELSLQRRDASGAATSTATVHRIARAPITSCRLAGGAPGQVGVLWSEIEPPADRRLYFSVVTP
ncbi:MAG: hypothetical protein ABI321_01815 [Polyangia bacterium]